ncbi:hypothetical protein F4777DRAFT_531678 [Nemania sp. FL0916]|nr:hypothetical protein F4777DRAFT_531678 [Nemania sp. FL0916]
MTSLSQSSGSPGSEMDPLEMLDLTDYDNMPYQSPALSPSATNKMQFARPTPAITTTPPTMPPNQLLSGPSHQYDQYKQQTPLVPGALANTLAINEGSVHIPNYNVGYINPGDEMYEWNGLSPQESITTPTMDLDFDSAAESFLSTPTINPRAVNARSSITNPAGAAGRMYPGIHQHLAKAQAQQQQQQHLQQQQHQEILQRQNMQRRQQQMKQSRQKSSQSTDPLVEQKITQLLNSMRSQVSTSETQDDSPLLQIPRVKKEEEDMDDDERLLASEEGKKLTSKERRQLRNKVSARAFRSRRKEYIGQLENDIAKKITENNDLRAQNQALVRENKRLSDLTHMLLSSPPFSSFLDTLSTDPSLSQPQTQPQPQLEQRQSDPAQVLKDANPFNSVGSGHQQQIGMVMVPEQRIDFSMLNLNSSNYGYQPQVFAVLETPGFPEIPEINTENLMGKSSNFVGEPPALDNDKTDAPSLEVPVSPSIEKPQAPTPTENSTTVEKVAADLDGDIFDDNDSTISRPQSLELNQDSLSAVDIFGGIEPEKAFARYEMPDTSEDEEVACIALRRIERLAQSLEATFSSLGRLDTDI